VPRTDAGSDTTLEHEEAGTATSRREGGVRLVYNDESHSYWIDGKRVKGMTTVAKIGDESYALEQWRKRQIAIGMALQPHLAEAVAADFDDKDKVNALCEKAMEAAQAHVAAAVGTTVHRITERIDLDLPLIETPLSRAIRAAWTLALEKAGLRIDPLYVERFVVWPEQDVAGRLDRLVWEGEELVVLDVKNGATVTRYPRPVAIQLAGYAYAPLLAGAMGPSGKNGSVAAESFFDMNTLPINKEKAYVVHTAGVADGEVAEVLEVDIAEGYKALTTIVFPALKWQKVIPERLMRPVASAPIAVEGEGCSFPTSTSTSTAQPSNTPSSSTTTSSTMSIGSTSTVAPESTSTTSLNSRRQQILARLTTLPEAQRKAIRAAWPAHVPSLKHIAHTHTDAEFDEIEALIAKCTRTVMDVANGLAEDRAILRRKAIDPADNGVTFDEGPLVPDDDVAALRKAVDELEGLESRMLLSRYCGEAKQAGYSLSMVANPATTRRWTIGTAALHLARGPEEDRWPEEVVRLMLGVVLGTDAAEFANVTIGQCLAALTIDEAERLTRLVDAKDDGAVLVWPLPDGAFIINGPAVGAAKPAA
jgi:PD-(D/E)XK nuclease superfamily